MQISLNVRHIGLFGFYLHGSMLPVVIKVHKVTDQRKYIIPAGFWGERSVDRVVKSFLLLWLRQIQEGYLYLVESRKTFPEKKKKGFMYFNSI